MGSIREALESQRRIEQGFVDSVRHSEKAPRGWPAALVMFHIGMWRERLRNALTDLAEGRDHWPPPANIDELNDAELASGIGTPLADAAARSDQLLREIIDLYDGVGARPFAWFTAKDTSDAVLRNSYTHPRLHMVQYLRENDRLSDGADMWEKAVTELRSASASGAILGAALYNLASARTAQDRHDEALSLLGEGLPMRPDLKAEAGNDPDLEALRDDLRFQELIKS